MSTQIAVRLSEDDLAALDREVAEGRAGSRSEALRRGIAYIRRQQRYRNDDAVLLELTRREEAVYPELEGLGSVVPPAID
ncbi:MAG: ribbon-helix-helix domain-containing protein [Kineosporiaceae bacterium]